MADKAFLTGINEYESISDLQGCVNDVANIKQLLISTYGFDEANIRTLTDEGVMRDAIIDGFRWLASDASDGDRLVFHFSGHGSHTPSEDDDEADDELICLWDMDWDNDQSYLRDDDLRELTETVAQGRLTMVLDCCHSGTGTRALSQAFKPRKSASPSSRMIIEHDTNAVRPLGARSSLHFDFNSSKLQELLKEHPTNVVQARYAPPPAKFQRKRPATRVHRMGALLRPRSSARPESSMNHQLLAGAADNQTAADAYINGDYNGAFTYYMCEQGRQQPAGSYDSVMDAAIDVIRRRGFSQVPQNEGPFGGETLFGTASASSPVSPSRPQADSISRPAATAAEGAADPGHAGMQLLQQMLTVSQSFIDLSHSLLQTGAGSAPTPTAASAARSGNTELVYVHGIGDHRPGFSDPWYASLSPHLTSALPHSEVVWSQHVNSRDVSTAADQAAMRQLGAEIEAELQLRQQFHGPRAVDRSLKIDDFVRYMLVESTRNAILAEFDKVVRPLLRAGRQLQIISHSWGTVVAYEGLRRMDTAAFSGTVETLFTVGAAISIGAVQSNLFDRLDDGRRPNHVQKVINLDAGGDIVGGAVGDEFDVFREFLGLEPTGCTTIPFTNIALNPSCAHSSYFVPANIEVNRDIFSRFIN